MDVRINKFICSLIFIVIADLNLFNCGIKEQSDKIRAITLKQQTPVINRDNSTTIVGGTYDVYLYNDLEMYKLNYRFDSMVNNELVFQEYRDYYFVSHRDSAYGYQYLIKPDKALFNNVRYKKDSLLKFKRFESDIYDTLLNVKPDSVYRKKEEIVKIYKNPPTVDTVQQVEKFDLYFYYTKKLKDIQETFSKKMDNEKGMKLVKIVVKASGGFYKEFNMTFPPREHFLEMKEIVIENRDEVLKYFKRYKEEKP